MTAEETFTGLMLNTYLFMVGSVLISFVICQLVLPRSDEKIYLSILLSATIPQFSCIFPSALYIMYSNQVQLLSPVGAMLRALAAVTVFFLPSILLIFLCLVIAVRHRGTETKSYAVEASIALVIVVAGVLWAAFVAEALYVAH